MSMEFIFILARMYIMYELLSIAAVAGSKGSLSLLIFDIVLAYIVFVRIWPLFPYPTTPEDN